MGEVHEDLRDVVRQLVDEPDAVEVEDFDEDDDVVLEVVVAPDDLGKVIGRQGRTARALRTLLEARGERDGEEYRLEIIDD